MPFKAMILAGLVLQPHISRLGNFHLGNWANSLREGTLAVAGSFSNQSWSMPQETNCDCSARVNSREMLP